MNGYLGQGFAEYVGDMAGLDEGERQVVAYGLEHLLVLAAGLVLMLMAGWLLGLLWEALLLLTCWVLIRVTAGGAHCTARWRCWVLNFTGLISALLLTRSMVYLVPTPYWVAFALTLAVGTVWVWAPNNSEKPVFQPARRRKLRFGALAVCLFAGLLMFLLHSSGWHLMPAAGATGVAAGALMITPVAHKLIYRVDRGLHLFELWFKNGFKKGGEKV